jgi:hypothetical protein
MITQTRFQLQHGEVFPRGAFLKSVEPVMDFKAPKRPDGSRPQQTDKETGLRMWQAVVLDADDQAGRRETAVLVKFAAEVQPVPPHNDTPFPWTPVEFVGLTALPYVDESGMRPRLAWSYRAESMIAPGEGRKANGSTAPAAAKAVS